MCASQRGSFKQGPGTRRLWVHDDISTGIESTCLETFIAILVLLQCPDTGSLFQEQFFFLLYFTKVSDNEGLIIFLKK